MASTDKSAATVKPKEKAVRQPAPARQSAPPRFQKVAKYLGEVRAELKKTTWPSRSELISQTQVVLGLLALIGVFIASWDVLLGFLVSGLFRLLGVDVQKG